MDSLPLLWSYSPWYFTLVLALPLLVGHPSAFVPCHTRGGEGQGSLELTCSVALERGRGMAATVGMCSGYIDCWKSLQSEVDHVLSQVVGSFEEPSCRGSQEVVSGDLCLFIAWWPLQQPSYPPLWSQTPGPSHPQFLAFVLALAVACPQACPRPTSGVADCSPIILPMALMKAGSAELEGPHNNDLLPFWQVQAFPWTPSAVSY